MLVRCSGGRTSTFLTWGLRKTQYGLLLATSEEGLAFEISFTKSIKADREFVFDWWTDLSSDDSSLVKPLKRRDVVSRTPETILLRDEEEMYFKRMVLDVKVTLERPERWVAEYDGKDARARSEYRLQQEGDGSTTLFYHTRIEPKGHLTKAFSPVVKPFVRRVFAGEMNAFIRSLEEDFGRRSAVLA